MFPDFSFSLPHVNEYKNISLYLHLVSAILFWCQCPQFKTRWRTPKLLKCNFILLFLHSGCMDQNNFRINKKNKCLFCADCSFVLIAVLCSLQFCAHCSFVYSREEGHFNGIPVDLSAQCESLMERLPKFFPQFEMSGKHNVWIVKPGAMSRGRGRVKLLCNLHVLLARLSLVSGFSWHFDHRPLPSDVPVSIILM